MSQWGACDRFVFYFRDEISRFAQYARSHKRQVTRTCPPQITRTSQDSERRETSRDPAGQNPVHQTPSHVQGTGAPVISRRYIIPPTDVQAMHANRFTRRGRCDDTGTGAWKGGWRGAEWKGAGRRASGTAMGERSRRRHARPPRDGRQCRLVG